ncbi:MAG: RNase adapter RapZ [Bacteroidota bacterium]
MTAHLKEKISTLFHKQFSIFPQEITELAASGSNRIYFRIRSDSISSIAAYNNDTKENLAFINFTKQFQKAGLPVPIVLQEDLNENIYLLNDLGDETLYSYLENNKAQGFTISLIELYKNVLRDLLRFQFETRNSFDYSACYPRASFDKQSMMWDLNYFKYYFLKLAGIQFDEQKLEDDFIVFSDYLLKTDCNYFLYRDFQSRNIMLHNNKVFYIDYQGGRKGALQYDVASLLYDAKADIPQKLREELLDYYIQLLKHETLIDETLFRQFYYGYVLIRIMQAMGAYGFRGFYENKTHFLKSIPYAVANLKWVISNIELPIKVDTLLDVFHNITTSEKLQKFSIEKADKLTVYINSFSYKKGYPLDSSGNGGGFVFDCRALPNPGRYEQYKSLTGKDDSVKTYLEEYSEVELFFKNTANLVCQSVSNYIKRGFNILTVNYGCTGGQHRSVYFAEQLAKLLRNKYEIKVVLTHKEQPTI